jgi:hypothetical protein
MRADAGDCAGTLSTDGEHGSSKQFDNADWRAVQLDSESRKLFKRKLNREHRGSGERQEPRSGCLGKGNLGNPRQGGGIAQHYLEIRYTA